MRERKPKKRKDKFRKISQREEKGYRERKIGRR